MIFRSLSVYNFGVFKGHHTFDLMPVDNQQGKQSSVTVFLGHNGAGKSTLFQAIALALYGPMAVSQRMSRNEYSVFLLSRLHRQNDDGAPSISREAGVALGFDYVRSGERLRIQVERRWHRKQVRVEEKLEVLAGGKPLGIHTDDYQSWLNDLFPVGLLPVCFFDAEQLETLANPLSHDTVLGDTLHRLLCLDLVCRLDADLEYVIAQSNTSKRADRVRAERRTIEVRMGELQDKLTNLNSRLSMLAEQEELLKTRLGAQERKLAAEGGSYAERRPLIQQRVANLNPEIEAVESSIRDLSNGLLPFALCPSLCLALEERLDQEERLHRFQVAFELWYERVACVEAALEDDTFWKEIHVSEAERESVGRQLLSLLQLPDGDNTVSSSPLVHRLTQEDLNKLKSWIRQTWSLLPQQVALLGLQLRGLRREREDLLNELDCAPDHEVLAPFHREILKLQSSLVELRRERDSLKKDEGSLTFQMEDLTRELRQAVERLAAFASKEEQAQVAAKVKVVLNNYRDTLLRKRLAVLEESLVTAFNGVCRKDRLLTRARIDPETYRVAMRGADGHTIGIDNLSAGERQLYSLALLQALRQASDRQLPLVIDSPFARLDDVHRPRVLDRYLPQVSRQVLVFATDSEITSDMLEHAKPHLARVYLLAFDSDSGDTKVSLNQVAFQFGLNEIASLDEDVFV